MTKSATLCDGGFSTQLSRYVEEKVDGDPLWTAKFLRLHPHKCKLVHKDFVIAGAEVISTGSYQSSIDGYKRYLGLDREEALDVIRDSVKLAKEGVRLAQEETGLDYVVQVAGSVGPYGAFLHDGSEYTGAYSNAVTEEFLIAWHRPRFEALVEAGVDLLAIETIPCLKEALALIRLLKQHPNVKAWISFSIKDSQSISSGENFCEAAIKCWQESNQLVAVGGNCFHPSIVSNLINQLRNSHPHIPTIVYPNNGEKYDAKSGRWLDKENNVNIEDYVNDWLTLGIDYIGGCCRTNSEDISHIRNNIEHWKKNHV